MFSVINSHKRYICKKFKLLTQIHHCFISQCDPILISLVWPYQFFYSSDFRCHQLVYSPTFTHIVDTTPTAVYHIYIYINNIHAV